MPWRILADTLTRSMREMEPLLRLGLRAMRMNGARLIFLNGRESCPTNFETPSQVEVNSPVI